MMTIGQVIDFNYLGQSIDIIASLSELTIILTSFKAIEPTSNKWQGQGRQFSKKPASYLTIVVERTNEKIEQFACEYL